MKVLRNGKTVEVPEPVEGREPKGCPTPGACSCVADPREATIAELHQRYSAISAEYKLCRERLLTIVAGEVTADATIARLSGDLEAAREALEPFARFAEKAEAFVESRAGASNDASGIMAPTKDFRLSDFVRARAVLAKLSKGA